MVDVEQHALRAFEQDALAAAQRASSRSRHTGLGEGQDEVGDFGEVVVQPLAVDRRLAEAGAERVVVRAQAVEQRVRGRRAGRGRRRGSRGGRPCPRRPGRCRAAWCRSCPRPTASSRSASRSRWIGRISGQVSAIISTSGVTSTPCSRMRSTSAFSAHGSSTTPLPITDGVPRTMPDGQQRELVGLVADDERVAGVVAALEAHDHVGAARQPVDDLALAFVAPLGADDGDVSHVVPSCCAARAALGAKRGASSADNR